MTYGLGEWCWCFDCMVGAMGDVSLVIEELKSWEIARLVRMGDGVWGLTMWV